MGNFHEAGLGAEEMIEELNRPRRIFTVNIYPRKVYKWYDLEKREWDWILSPHEFGRTNLSLKDLIGWVKEHFRGCEVRVHKYPFDIGEH